MSTINRSSPFARRLLRNFNELLVLLYWLYCVVPSHEHPAFSSPRLLILGLYRATCTSTTSTTVTLEGYQCVSSAGFRVRSTLALDAHFFVNSISDERKKTNNVKKQIPVLYTLHHQVHIIIIWRKFIARGWAKLWIADGSCRWKMTTSVGGVVHYYSNRVVR